MRSRVFGRAHLQPTPCRAGQALALWRLSCQPLRCCAGATRGSVGVPARLLRFGLRRGESAMQHLQLGFNTEEQRHPRQRGAGYQGVAPLCTPVCNGKGNQRRWFISLLATSKALVSRRLLACNVHRCLLIAALRLAAAAALFLVQASVSVNACLPYLLAVDRGRGWGTYFGID